MDLELANKRLQLRIKQLEEEVAQLKQRLSDSQMHLGRAHQRIAEVIKEIPVKKAKPDTSTKVVYVKNGTPNKKFDDKTKIKSRQKVIYGILKNPKGYSLNEYEKNFLVGIQNVKVLSQPQFNKLNEIKNRGK
jgi:hypothetical protein